MTTRDLYEEMLDARRKAQARRDAAQQAARREQEAQHVAAREAYKDELRIAYKGPRDDFERFVWPAKRAEWELQQAENGDAVKANMERLLASNHYHGF